MVLTSFQVRGGNAIASSRQFAPGVPRQPPDKSPVLPRNALMGFTPLHGLAAKGMTQEIQKLVDNDWVPVSVEIGKHSLRHYLSGRSLNESSNRRMEARSCAGTGSWCWWL